MALILPGKNFRLQYLMRSVQRQQFPTISFVACIRALDLTPRIAIVNSYCGPNFTDWAPRAPVEGAATIMGLTKLVIRGARQHNLKNINLEIPRNSLDGDHRACPAPASLRSRSTRSMRRASAATSNRSRPTRGSFSIRWSAPKWMSSRGCRPPSPSSKRPPRGRRAPPSAPSPRFTITCA